MFDFKKYMTFDWVWVVMFHLFVLLTSGKFYFNFGLDFNDFRFICADVTWAVINKM